LGNFLNVFLLQILVILLFLFLKSPNFSYKKLGEKKHLAENIPQKKYKLKSYIIKKKERKKKKKARWVLEHPYSEVRGKSTNLPDCFIAFPTRPTEGLGRFFYCRWC
jgi:hypothetical protein